MIKSLLLRLAHKAGYRITKMDLAQELLGQLTQGPPLYVELIGPAGIGKTTLMKSLDGYRQGWISDTDFRWMIGDRTRYASANWEEMYQALTGFMLNRVVNRPYQPLDKMRVIRSLKGVIERDITVRTHNDRYAILSDEGIVQNASPYIIHALESGTAEEGFFHNRAYVHFKATPEILAKQVMKRYNETGLIIAEHAGKTMEELARFQQEILLIKERLCMLLEKEGVPVLHIDVLDGPETNKREILDFMEALRNGDTGQLQAGHGSRPGSA